MKHFKKLLTEEFIALTTLILLSATFFASNFFVSHAAGSFQTGDIFKGKNITTGQTSYSDPVNGSNGQRLRFNLLVWNQGTDPATNTRVTFDLSNPIQPKATINADGGVQVSDVVVINPSGASLKIVDGSGLKYGPGCPSGCGLSDGELINGFNLGTVAIGGTSSYQISFEVDVIGTPPGAQTSFNSGNIFDGGNRSRSLAAWEDPIPALPGETVEFRTTVINNGSVDAKNVIVRGQLPSSQTLNLVATSFVSADNANLVNDTATVNVGGSQTQKLIYLPGHARMFGPGCNTSSGCSLSDNIVQGGVNIGTVKPGNSNSYQVAFKATVTNYVVVTPSPSPTPTKTPSPKPTPTKSPSPTPTPTRSPSPTPTKSPSPKPTPTRSPSPKPTPTKSPSPTPTKSPSPTPSPTPPPQCNSLCVTSSQCPAGLTCSWGRCRNPSCTKNSNCICQSPTPTPSPKPSKSPSPTPKPSKSPSPTPTSSPTPSPTATAVPDSKLRVCKYDDKNGNGQIDSGEGKMTWSFRYSYQDKEYQLSTPWWNVFGDKCKTVTVPSSQWIKVWEDGKNDWSLTNIFSDGNAVGGTEYNYVSYQNVQKEVSFLNHYSTQPTTTPTITPAPSGEPNSCNGTCGSNYNCKSGLFCYNGYCRNPSCQTESSCGCPGATATPVAPQVLSATAPPQLPKTGAEPLAIAVGFVGLAGTGFWLFRKFKLV